VILNVGLFGIVVWQTRLLRQQRHAADGIGVESHFVNRASDSAAAAPLGAGAHLNPVAQPVTQSGAVRPNSPSAPTGVSLSPTNWPKFDWRLVESEDYRTYVKNLRAIGCPDQTIRDVVTADLSQAFSVRRAEVAATRYADFKFNEYDDAADASFARSRQNVDAAMNDAVRQLLGADQTPPNLDAAWTQAVVGQQLAFLPEGKRGEALAVLARFGLVDVSLPEGSISNNRLNSTQAEELKRRLETFDQKRSELLRTLTPEEYEQLDMTVSWTGKNLRQAMANFHPSETEFAAIFRAWRIEDERVAEAWANGQPDSGNDNVFTAIEERLGPERYQLYRATWWK